MRYIIDAIKHALSYLKDVEGNGCREEDCLNIATNSLNHALELLNGIWHPAKEEPRNDYSEVLLVCEEPNGSILLDMNTFLDDIEEETYQEAWHNYCENTKATRWCYIDDLTKKGGEQ